MDPASILLDVQIAISVAKAAYELGQDARPFILAAYQIAFGHKTLTDAERKAMQDQEIALRKQIDAAIADDDAAGG